MAKESSFKTFPIIWLVKDAFVRFYMNITGYLGITIYWFKTVFIISFKEKIVFVKFFETSVVSDYVLHLLTFNVLLVLFERKPLKFTFKAVCYINNT